jgi:predicted secreted hydrolase
MPIHRRRAGWLGTAGLVCAVAFGLAAGAASSAEVRSVVLPRDHGAHPEFQIEWWYGAGLVRDRLGRPYAWFATVWAGAPGALGRVNVVDLRSDRVVLSGEYPAVGWRAAPGLVDLALDGYRLRWRPTGELGRYTVDAGAEREGLRLGLVPRRRYVLHGRRGVIEQGGGGPSAYYSSTRLAVRGTLRLGDRRIAVSGEGWIDHQWGNFAGTPEASRWDWFSCRFEDGRDLMLYRFLDLQNRPRPAYFTGTLVDRGGRVQRIARFHASPRAPFLRPDWSTATYPLGWRLRVPGARIDITLRTLARNQFIRNQLVPSFWEGAATVTRGGPALCFVENSREPLTLALPEP